MTKIAKPAARKTAANLQTQSGKPDKRRQACGTANQPP